MSTVNSTRYNILINLFTLIILLISVCQSFMWHNKRQNENAIDALANHLWLNIYSNAFLQIIPFFGLIMVPSH